MKSFEQYLEEGTIKVIQKNIKRAKSLILEANRKLLSLNEKISKIGVKDHNANDYLEHCYDIIMFLIRAELYEEGYTSQGSHEAEVSYLIKLGFKEKEVEFIDQVRYYRNRILYYGKRFDSEYALKVIKKTKEIYEKMCK